jgi:hypothetical protein
VDYFAHKCHKSLWHHIKLFSVECKHWMLFLKMYASISKKIQQEIVSEVGDVFIYYYIILIDMLDFKNLIWRLIRTRNLSYGMSVVDLMVKISQWKNMLYYNCIRIINMMYILQCSCYRIRQSRTEGFTGDVTKWWIDNNRETVCLFIP